MCFRWCRVKNALKESWCGVGRSCFSRCGGWSCAWMDGGDVFHGKDRLNSNIVWLERGEEV